MGSWKWIQIQHWSAADEIFYPDNSKVCSRKKLPYKFPLSKRIRLQFPFVNVKHPSEYKNNHNLVICRSAISTICSPFLPVVTLFPSQPRNACRRVINRPSQYSLDPSKWNCCDRLETTDYAYPTNARTELHGTSTIPIHFRTDALHPLPRDDEALNATMI